MLRITLLIVGGLLLFAAFLLLAHPQWLGITLYLGVYGLIIVGGLLLERSRYQPRVNRLRGQWQPTGERFVDPTTQRLMDVYFNPDTGQRDYREAAEKTGWKTAALLLLVIAAGLEAGGDALVRAGLFGPSLPRRLALLLCGALVLFAYGCCVNLPRWDFGRLLGIYVAAFFLMAQVINWVGFHQKPTLPILAGGTLIVAGGLVISLWKP